MDEQAKSGVGRVTTLRLSSGVTFALGVVVGFLAAALLMLEILIVVTRR